MMKKVLYLVAIATLVISACQKAKEIEPEPESPADPEETVVPEENTNPENNAEPFIFKASIEGLGADTKGTINASHQMLWAEGDKIGIYFPTWGDKNQAFTLSGGAGTTLGEFTRDDPYAYDPADATAAFYPWQGTGSSKNNVYEDVMYFKLPSEYWSYNDGDMLTPLVASVSSSENIAFKHAGAAVKLTINNLVSGTYKVKMSVTDKQITGDFHINPANAGTDALALDNAENTSLNSITLNSWKSTGAFSWIFPVPALTKPKLQFEIKDENGVVVMAKNLKAQTSDVGRGDILVMPALSITAYKQFDANATWGVCGTHNSWSGDTKMVTDGTLCIAKSIAFAANAEFKIRTVGTWGDYGTNNFGAGTLNAGKSTNTTTNGENLKVTAAGSYDVIFNSSASEYCGFGAHEIRVVQSKYPYPLPKETAEITIDGTFTDWDGVTSESAGNTTVKVVSDNTKVYFYVQITGAPSTIWGGSNYLYVLFDLDGDPSNDADQWGNKGDFIMLIYPYGGSSESPAFITSPNGNWLCKPSSPYTIANVGLNGAFSDADGSGNRTVTYEFSIPRADMPTIPSTDPVTLTFKGSPISSNPSISRIL